MHLTTYMLSAAAIALTISADASASIPDGYYDSAKGKATSELKSALCGIILPHEEVSSYSALPSYFQRTDLYPESQRWWDMYSDIPLYAPSFKGLNREHSLPKSWWGGSTATPAYVDLFHLYPSEAAANRAKSNYPLGIVTGEPRFDNGISKVGYGVNSGGAALVFEPDDEYKGDFARTYFYMVTCYQDFKWKYTYMTRDGVYPSLQGWAIDLLLDWHRSDPVSQKELDRNEAVYLIQTNRNPFIDYPELAELIWGNRMGETFDPGHDPTPGGDPELITPQQDAWLDFGETAIDMPVTSHLFFSGRNLTGSLELTIAGSDADCFTVPSPTISASAVNSASGFWLEVKFTPARLGRHEASLIIQDGGITGSVAVGLSGEALEVPELSPVVATAPTDITSDSYTATWLAPADEDEIIDYYLLTRTCYTNGNASTELLLAEDNYLEITGFDASDSETYSVQSVRLGHKSEPSNVITVTHSALAAADAAEPLAVETHEGFIRLRCGSPQTGCRVIDSSGKTVMFVPTVEPYTELQLQPGVYILTTDQHPSPVKVLAR